MTVLVVDDEPVFARLLQLTLERNGFAVATASSAAEALEWLAQTHGVELVITDHHLGAMTGLEFFSALRADVRWCRLPVILCTGAADRATVEDAMGRGLHHFLVKPIRATQLMEKVNRALADQLAILERRFDTMARLGLSEREYLILVKTSSERLSTLGRELAAARKGRHLIEARLIAERVREPAELLRAVRCLAALDEVAIAQDERGRELALAAVDQEIATLTDVLAGPRPRIAPSGRTGIEPGSARLP
jgi:CheY-like chemotaxis protein